MALVALRHLMSVHDLDPSVVSTLLGLPSFSALSGFLSLASRGSTTTWLSRRLARVYVSYWLFLLPLLAINALYSYKPTDWWLIASQFLGLGTLTHPDRLVGVH